MTSKRELERELSWKRRRVSSLEEDREIARDENRRLRSGLERIAKLYGFYDAYVREERYLIDHDTPERAAVCVRNVFSTGALIDDLDTIDQATSADEARKRLGIKEEA